MGRMTGFKITITSSPSLDTHVTPWHTDCNTSMPKIYPTIVRVRRRYAGIYHLLEKYHI
jgi:hypothetical protein